MADYYPLIARAVEGLPEQNPDTRHAVYERARTALVAQLRSLNPPLSEAEIQQESRSLDAAIDRVEADYAPLAGFDPDAAPTLPDEEPPARPAPEGARGAASVHGLRAPAPQPARDDEFEDSYAEPAVSRPKIDSRPHPAMQSKGRARTIVFGSVLALVIAAIAAFAFLWRDRPEDLAPETPVAEAPAAPPADSKINERVGGQAPPAAAAAPNPAPRQETGVAQRAVFYEEDPANPSAPKAQVGRVTWRLEDVNPGQGQPLERAVVANVDVPDAGLAMKMVLRRNLDTTLPASHTVELTFTTREGDTNRVIRDVGLLQFKSEEAARGTPVAGLPVPVRENLFLIGLSNLQADIARNTQLFVRRNWIDLPVRMASGQRAILSFEKGGSGEQIINDAFSQWQ
ncbi:histidine kinase [Microvirga splendida]|uniref:Histidine kinase n=1 Tax=Microvirga splendida TaxID=2795727 RepID=A0ABS0Y6X1_9HYPH|nr:histidine kinase [Microvirga splendida]MBJ6128050.1 histidine kinase [Microvirga splendida]